VASELNIGKEEPPYASIKLTSSAAGDVQYALVGSLEPEPPFWKRRRSQYSSGLSSRVLQRATPKFGAVINESTPVAAQHPHQWRVCQPGGSQGRLSEMLGLEGVGEAGEAE
jgi:hypothetical protein